MAINTENSFAISEDGLSLNNEALILHGTVDPSLAPGQEAPIGSIFLRTDVANVYQKFGNVDTNWNLINATNTGSSDIPVCQVRRSATLAIPLSYTDVNFDLTDLETDTPILEHDPLNTDRILIKESGLYGINYSFSVDANSGENVFNFRVRINDTTVIPISEREISEDDEINAVSNSFFTLLSAGDFITLQVQSNGTGDVLWNTSNFGIFKATGIQGIQGPPGAGSTVIVKDDGVLLPNNPYDTINFNGFTVNDNTTEVEIVAPVPIFGTEFAHSESLGVTSTTSTTLQTKNTLIVTVPAGTYRIGVSYGWNFNSTGNDFIGEIHEDGVLINNLHQQEPKDVAGNFSNTGSNQRYYMNRTYYRTLNAGTYTYEVKFRSNLSGTTASIWDCIIEFWRVS